MKDLSLHFMDIVQNSVRAGANEIDLFLWENKLRDAYQIRVKDNGRGIDPKMLKNISDPYVTSRTTRKVGMGLSLFRQNAEMSGGNFKISSELGKGTIVSVEFGLSHIDRPPIGDIESTIALLISSYPDIEFQYRHITTKGRMDLDSREIKKELDGVPVNHPAVIRFIKEYLKEHLDKIEIER